MVWFGIKMGVRELYVYEKSIFKGAELAVSNCLAYYMADSNVYNDEVNDCLSRFLAQDWGDMSPRACKANDIILQQHLEPLMGIYETSRTSVAIIASGYSRGRYQMVEMAALYSEIFHIYVTNN